MLTPLFLFFFLASRASAQVTLNNGASHAGAISPANIMVSSTAPSPLSVTNGLQLWLRADAGTTVNTNGGVTAWADFSGNFNNATQRVGSLTPQWVTNALNGKPVLRFDGGNDYLEVATSLSLAITGDITSLFVVKFDDFATYRTVWSKTSDNLPRPTDYYALPGSGIPRLFRVGPAGIGYMDGSDPLPAATYIIAGFDMAGTLVTHYLNGQSIGSGNITAVPVDTGNPLRIGTRADLLTKMKGDIAEILIYSTALSDADRSAVIDYLNKKYFLAGAQPGLSIAKAANDAFTLSWPASVTDFILEVTDNLAPATWTAVTEPVVVSGGSNTVTVPATSGTSGYFRLHQLPPPLIPPHGPVTVTTNDFDSLQSAIHGVATLSFDGVVEFRRTLVIAADTTLDATGHTVSFDARQALRHFVVTNSATLRLVNLTLANGRFAGPDGGTDKNGSPGLGGSIRSSGGNLELLGCTFINNSVLGGSGGAPVILGGGFSSSTSGAPGYGGAIYLSDGRLSATNCRFANNSSTGGQGQSGTIYTAPGADAFGGAIFSTQGIATLVAVAFTNNSVHAGELRGGRAGAGGGQSWGGAFADAGTASTLISNCVFMANRAVGATKVASAVGETGNANGGAVFHQSGSMTIEGTLFSKNTATGGGGFERGVTTTLSAPGNGGAVFNQSGSLQVRNSALIFNQANGGPVTSDPPWEARAGTGSGGGIYNAGMMSLLNCTLAENSANGGAGAHGFAGDEPGGPAYGGSVFNDGGSASLMNLTIAGNAVQPGMLGNPEFLGASISTTNGSLVLTNTILFCSPSQTNVSGAIIDGGHNICSDGSANFALPSSRNSTDPLLDALSNNGGLTPSIALLPNSPAIDSGDYLACPPTDQRGVPRPQRLACDIGAFELSP